MNVTVGTSESIQSGRTVSASLRKNFSWTFAGNVAGMLGQFAMLLATARLGSVEMVGQYGLGLAITAPVFLFVGLSLRSVQVTDVNDRFMFSHYAALRALGLGVGLAIVLLVVVVSGYSLSTAAVVLLIGTSKCMEGMSDIILGVFHKHERMDVIAKSMTIRAIATSLGFAVALWFTSSLVVSICCVSIIMLGHLLLVDARRLEKMDGMATWSVTTLRTFVRDFRQGENFRIGLVALALLSLPVGITSALVSLNTNIPRYIIEWSGGTDELGVFTALSYPLIAGNTVVNALSQSTLPRLARLYAERRIRPFIGLILRLIALGLALAIFSISASIWGGELILQIVFGAIYAEHHWVFTVLTIGMGFGFLNWFLNSALHAARAFRTLLGFQVVTTVSTMALAFFVVPDHGILGAAWVLAGLSALQVIMKSSYLAIRLGREARVSSLE